jgi:integrase
MKTLTRSQERNARAAAERHDGQHDAVRFEDMRQRRVREQVGVEVLYADGFYVRYFVDDADGRRVRVRHKLGGLDMDKMARVRAQRAFMEEVNRANRRGIAVATGAADPADVLTIGQFYDSFYKPNIDEGRASTAGSYDKIWREKCCEKLGSRRIREFGTSDVLDFLEPLYKRLNRNSLSNVKSMMSGLFTYAVKLEKISVNPWRGDAVALDKKKLRYPATRPVYSVEERDVVLAAIKQNGGVHNLEARVWFALLSVTGLRPSEVAATRWDNIDMNAKPYPLMRVTEAAVYGVVERCKTEKSRRTLVVVEPLLSLLREYNHLRSSLGGYLFQNRRNESGVYDSTQYARRYIRPCLQTLIDGKWVNRPGVEWKKSYAGRHAAATNVYRSTRNIFIVAKMLGNSPATATATYVRASMDETHRAMIEQAEIESARKA